MRVDYILTQNGEFLSLARLIVDYFIYRLVSLVQIFAFLYEGNLRHDHLFNSRGVCWGMSLNASTEQRLNAKARMCQSVNN